MAEIKLGKYQNYKGNFYEVLGVAKHTETMEDFVVYKSLYDSPEFPIGSIWLRPKEMFFGQVEVNGQKVPRFKFMSDL
ncbi:MAG: DUF1653 domain-containing protein [Candidatus Gribaldobacteria bacterium]|nr:DUF1653 domain-containing protein [Candidatus Gribaldobacteria bacterium]